MNFNKTTEYALRITGYMALDERELHTADDIYKRLRIPYRYLRKQLTYLSKSGLIVSVRGKKGGYRIARDLHDISLLEIIQAAGEDQVRDDCFFGFQKCPFQNQCAMHTRWTSVREIMYHVLSSTSLAEIKESTSK